MKMLKNKFITITRYIYRHIIFGIILGLWYYFMLAYSKNIVDNKLFGIFILFILGWVGFLIYNIVFIIEVLSNDFECISGFCNKLLMRGRTNLYYNGLRIKMKNKKIMTLSINGYFGKQLSKLYIYKYSYVVWYTKRTQKVVKIEQENGDIVLQ